MKVDSLMVIPIVGLAQALQPVIGINYGANNYRRVKNAYIIFAIIGTTLLLFIWLPLQIVPTVFLNIVLPGVNFTIEDVINFRILNILTPIWPLAYCSNTLFISIGKPQVVLLTIFLKSIVLNVPMMIFFSKITGLRGIYLGSILADFIFMLIVLILTVKEFKNLSNFN
jgi:Na+-driven multidrug efflux pump